MSQHIIALSTIGKVNRQILPPIKTEISRIFGCSTEEVQLLDDIEFAYHPGRRQYYSTLVLKELSDLISPRYLKVLAIVDVDLFIPILTHVYGEAQLNGKACIISTLRLDEVLDANVSSNNFYFRVVKEVLHELGHTFNLKHCKDPGCIMHYCRSLQEVDKKSDSFCFTCEVLLQDEFSKLKP